MNQIKYDSTASFQENKGHIFVDYSLDELDPEIIHIRMHNKDVTVDIINIGCAITGIYTPDRQGERRNIVAAYDRVDHYRTNAAYLGVIVGRYANRIAGGCFALDGEEIKLSVNNGSNHLHGGFQGFSHKTWSLVLLEQDGRRCRVKFSYTSPDGEEGYPGDLQVAVTYILDDTGKLHLEYEATTTRSTPVNLTNHTYFNLTGFECPKVLDHLLQVNAAHYTEKNAGNTSSGVISPVKGTALDFCMPRALSADIAYFKEDMGYDQNFVLQSAPAGDLIKAAVLNDPYTGRVLTVYTSQPALQVYTANYWDGSITGIQGKAYQQHGAVALETQAFPDSVRFAHFPDTVLRPGEIYRATTIFAFGLDNGV